MGKYLMQSYGRNAWGIILHFKGTIPQDSLHFKGTIPPDSLRLKGTIPRDSVWAIGSCNTVL